MLASRTTVRRGEQTKAMATSRTDDTRHTRHPRAGALARLELSPRREARVLHALARRGSPDIRARARRRSAVSESASRRDLDIRAVPRGTDRCSRAAREAARATPQLAAAPVPPVAGERGAGRATALFAALKAAQGSTAGCAKGGSDCKAIFIAALFDGAARAGRAGRNRGSRGIDGIGRQ